MRIISGIFKGKKILDPKDIKTRPLKDLTKELIFNIINHSKKFNINLKELVILDLFSGVGSFGIECLSREARKVIFVENYNGVLPILKKNLLSINSHIYEIFEKNIYDKSTFSKFNDRFDLIFLDPPYKDKNLETVLNHIKEAEILKKSGVIIIHRHKKEIDTLPKGFKIIEEKKYGISKIIFLIYLS
ncbi:16S rRNA (guanine(966)-N(2))-methyltransferase RsmD [Candidatus Pelagibacter bacterium nBUS_49]|uniref:16S rRNA (guanine(966)-N(2))-methyltransferase RsmD n=1 Tax=Candidatus Pelagibacter bacterium nBUS_49 TaxID=3374196 RepID=UPI003EBF0D15